MTVMLRRPDLGSISVVTILFHLVAVVLSLQTLRDFVPVSGKGTAGYCTGSQICSTAVLTGHRKFIIYRGGGYLSDNLGADRDNPISICRYGRNYHRLLFVVSAFFCFGYNLLPYRRPTLLRQRGCRCGEIILVTVADYYRFGATDMWRLVTFCRLILLACLYLQLGNLARRFAAVCGGLPALCR